MRPVLLALVLLALAGCGSGDSSEESFAVYQDGCAHLQQFTKKEVIETWGAEAVNSRNELAGGPAAINKECREHHEP